VRTAINDLPPNPARTRLDHLPRAEFIALLKRLARSGGLLIGNSSAGLIEAAILGLPAINLGPRQSGRERPATVIDVPEAHPRAISDAIARAASIDRSTVGHPYGDGTTGPRIAELLATIDPRDPALLRKHNAY